MGFIMDKINKKADKEKKAMQLMKAYFTLKNLLVSPSLTIPYLISVCSANSSTLCEAKGKSKLTRSPQLVELICYFSL